jgi:hypothetical protein
MQLVMCMENGEWCAGTSYKVRYHARVQLTGNSGAGYSGKYSNTEMGLC